MAWFPTASKPDESIAAAESTAFTVKISSIWLCQTHPGAAEYASIAAILHEVLLLGV